MIRFKDSAGLFTAALLASIIVVSAELPYVRYNSACQLLLSDTRIYCYSGGYAKVKNGEITPLGDHYYLDVSKNLSVADSYNAWIKVPDPTNFVTEATSAYVSVKLSDSSVLINGGTGINNGVNLMKNQTVVYHADNNQWETIPSTSGSAIPQTYYSSGALTADNTVVLWGGVQALGELLPTFNGTAIISPDSQKNSKWSLQPTAVAPGYPRYGHSATADKTGRLIYFIGGRDIVRSATGTYTRPYSTFTNVLVYHTDTGEWEQKAASSTNPPTNRMSHTATLIPSTGEILIYGGAGPDAAGNRIPSADYIHIYNPVQNTFRPVNIGGNSPSGAGPRYGHSAVLKNNLLFIIFGIDGTLSATADFHVLDIETLTWQQNVLVSGIPTSTDDTASKNDSSRANANGTQTDGVNNTNNLNQPQDNRNGNSDGLSSGAIAGICIGTLAGVAIIAVAAYCLRRRSQQKNFEKDDPYPTYWDVTSIDEIAAGAAAAAAAAVFEKPTSSGTHEQIMPHFDFSSYRQVSDVIESPAHTVKVNDLNAPAFITKGAPIAGYQERTNDDRTVVHATDAMSATTATISPTTSSNVYSKPDIK